MPKRLLQPLIFTALTVAMTFGGVPVVADNDDLKIPNLGASSTSLYSEDYERRLGRLWLKVFRAQAPVLDDPLLYDYVENLVFELVLHSDLRDRQLQPCMARVQRMVSSTLQPKMVRIAKAGALA